MKKKKSLTHRVKHHTKTIIRITPKFVHGMVVGAFVGAIVIVSLRAAHVDALTISSPRDCDTNAVISCGALTVDELQTRYSRAGVAAIYAHFGITAADINDMDTTATAGRVYKDGAVKIGGVTVATGAVTAGRENISGSTKVTSGGVTFYKRPPSVSFHPDSLAAFVVMKDGQFSYAILGACSNPVTATPVAKKTTPPPAPPEAPPVVPETPTPSTQTPPSTPVVMTASTVSVTKLPETGPGAVLIIGLLAVMGGYIFHATHRHVRKRRHARHNPVHPA